MRAADFNIVFVFSISLFHRGCVGDPRSVRRSATDSPVNNIMKLGNKSILTA